MLQFSEDKLPHDVVIYTYYTTHFDVNHIISSLEPNHNCSVSHNNYNGWESQCHFIFAVYYNL